VRPVSVEDIGKRGTDQGENFMGMRLGNILESGDLANES
jgi:hypothetical protein